MRFTSAHFLLLLPLVIWFWRSAASASASRRRVWRSAAATSLILALAGLQVRTGESPLSVMFVLDRSGSMVGADTESRRSIETLAATMRGDDRAGLVVFGTDAAVERPLTNLFDLPKTASTSTGTSTNIEGALRVARASLGQSGTRRIVLVSDGHATAGDMVAEATRAGTATVPVDVVVPAGSVGPGAIDVMRVSAPQTVRAGEPFAVVVTARGAPATRGTISLTSSDGKSWREGVTLSSDGFATAVFETRSNSDVLTFEAIAESVARDDFSVEPRRAGAVVTVAGQTRVLYVGETSHLLAPVFARAGFALEHIQAAAFPRTVQALSEYDAIVLDEVGTDQLDGAQGGALRTYVERHAGGLLFLGSRNSLEPGLLAGNAIGELLPIDVRPRSGQRAPSLGLVVAFDKSGSMDDRVDGVPRIEFARQAVRKVFDAVPASDAIGVIAFDSSAHVVAPLRAGHDTRMLSSSLASVQPSGATAIAPAVDMAAQWLREAGKLARRHVLLVSDGRTSAADAARLRAIAERGEFELSVVALGADADRGLLESVAQATGGRAYFPRDIRELPVIVARESARVAGGRLFEEPFQPVTRSHPLLARLDTGTLPRLGGYVVSVAKPSAESPIQSPLNDPVLATWRTGLGRVAAYTAELHAPWSARLREWGGFGTLFTQTLRWASRGVRDDALYVSFEEGDDGLRVTVDAQDVEGSRLNDLDCRAEVRTPRGEAISVVMEATAPGRYEARVATRDRGAYVFAISGVSSDRRVESRIVRGYYWSAEREYQARGTNLDLLTRVAHVSGGRLLHDNDSPFAMPRDPFYLDAWPWLAGAALMLFLAEVLLPARSAPLARSFRNPRGGTHSRSVAA